MNIRSARLALVPWFVFFAACSGDRVHEDIGIVEEALTANDRILGFEGTIGGAAGSDWRPVVGTATASTTHSEGAHSIALGGNTNPEAVSAALTALGPLSSNPSVDVELPVGYQNQGSYYGQLSVSVTCASANIFNQGVGTVALSSLTGSFKTYALPALPTNVSAALSNTSGCTLDVRLNLSNTGSKAVLVDHLFFGQVSGGGGTGGSGGGAGAGGKSGAGGTAGSSAAGAGAGGRAGGGGLAGMAGASGGSAAGGRAGAGGAGAAGAGTGGGGGAAGSPPGVNLEFFTELPAGLDRKSVALATQGGALMIDDNFRVVSDSSGFGSVSSVNTTAQTQLGVLSEVQDVWSQADVFLRSNAHVHGYIDTEGVVTQQTPVTIDGGKNEHETLSPVHHQAWTINFPAVNRGAISLEPGQPLSLSPGASGGASIKSSATLTLAGAGVYTFDGDFGMEPSSVLDVDNTHGAVQIYIRGGFTFRGQVSARDATRNNVLIGVGGTAPISIDAPFRGILVAPYADVSLSSASGHYGSVFARSITSHQNTPFHFLPFDPKDFCNIASTCSGLCPCTMPNSCDDDGDCGAGLACGFGEGPRFGKALGTNACWPIQCGQDVGRSSCGTVSSPCGQCEVPFRSCTDASQCATGEACTPGNGAYFGAPGVTMCWPQICTTAQNDHCGGPHAPCGVCDCSASCAGATCGGEMTDGCGGDCPHLCADRQAGCTMDANCADGSICVQGGGPRVGLPAGTNVCLPAVCANFDLSKVPCGSLGATCGLCPDCTPHCDGKCGGASDGCRGTCTNSCADGQSCSANGICTSDIEIPAVAIPDGLGGTKTVTPLDPGPTSDVGATAGAFGVSDTGKATYRIPIAVAPGRLGVEPSLSLTYGGTIRNGALGAGWYVEGLSTVARCRHTVNEDGYAAQIADDSSDRYCLDGVLLIPGSEQSNGGDGAVHYPEFDPRTRVISFGLGPAGPDFFKVWRANGLIYTYGNTADSSVYTNVDTGVKREWALNRVEDHAGNFMSITYLNSGPVDGDRATPDRATREILPLVIDYTGFDGSTEPPLPANRHVNFNYEPVGRPDASYGYAYAGHPVIRFRRLGSITTMVGNTVVRDYRIKYGDEIGEPAQNNISRVATIRECTGADCKQPTHFEYYDDAAQPFGAVVDTGINLQGGYGNLFGVIGVLDAEGDGLDDVLYETEVKETLSQDVDGFTFTSDALSPRWGMLAGQADPTSPLVKRSFGPYIGATYLHCATEQSNPNWSDINGNSIVDWNLDGKHDLMDWWQFDRIKLRAILGSQFTDVQNIQSGPSSAADCVQREYKQLVDVTGDGLPDIVHYDFEGRKTRIYVRDPTNPTTLKAPVIIPGQDLVLGNPSDTTYKEAWVDVDGDGAPEAVTNSGKNHQLTVRWVRPDVPSVTRHTFQNDTFVPFVDLNGDGIKDSIRTSVFLPSGSPFLRPTTIRLNAGLAASGLGGMRSIPNDPMSLDWDQTDEAMVADFNHDGKEDLLIPDQFRLNFWNIVSLDTSLDSSFNLQFHLRVIGTLASGPVSNPSPVIVHNFSPMFLGDFDGDGNVDFLTVGLNSHLVVVPGRGFSTNLLKTVTDGNGKRIDIKYAAGAPSNGAAGVYEAGSVCYPLSCNRRTGPLVSEHTEAQALNAGTTDPRVEHRVTYSYSDGRTDPADQRFIGFAKRTINEFDGTGASLRTTTINFDNSTRSGNGVFPLAGKRTLVTVNEPVVASALAPNVSTARRTETEYDWVVATGGGAGVYATLTDKETRSSELVGPAIFGNPEVRPVLTVHETYTTDPKFNSVTHILRTESTASSTSVSEIDIPPRTDQELLDAWLIDLPQHRIVTDTVYPSQLSTTRTITYDFYPTGMLKQVIREPDTAYYRLQRDLTRDGYGNAFQVTETSATNGLVGPSQVRSTITQYDADQIFPVTVTNALNQISYLDFDRRFGTPTLVADPNGIATQWAFDGFGRSTREVTPETETVTTYSSDIQQTAGPIAVRAVLKANSQTTGFGMTETAVDSFGRAVRATSTGLTGVLTSVETEYDQAGRKSKQSRRHLAGDTSQGITTYEYDAAGRLSTVIPADATRTMLVDYATRASVDVTTIGLPSLQDNYVTFTRTTAPNGGKDIAVRDARGELVASRDANGQWLTRAVGPFETSTTITSVDSITTLTSDRLGRLDTSTDPDRGLERYQYTAWDELDSYFVGAETSPRLKYLHDTLGRLTKLVSNTDGTATYQYDTDGAGGLNQIGRLVASTSFDGSERDLRYEAPRPGGNRGLLDHITDIVDGIQMTTVFTYTDVGQLDSTTYPGGSQPFRLQYCYDSAGFPSKIGRPGIGAAACPTLSETYWELIQADQGMRPKEERIGPMTTLKNYFDLTGQLRQLDTFPTLGGGEAIQEEEHGYDVDGNLQTRSAVIAGASKTETFSSDILNRLTSVVQDSNITTFSSTYSDNGNVSGLSTGGTLTYDTPNGFPAHSPHTAQNATYTYDPIGARHTASGDAVIGGTQTTNYDNLQQATHISLGGGTVSALDFKYLTTGERSEKIATGGNTVLYSGAYERTTLPGGTVEHKYRISSPSNEILEITRDASDTELSRVYLYPDLMGSPSIITDGDGTVLHTQKFGPYGAISFPTWQSSNPAVRRVTRGYTGHEHDPETGLVNMGARFYDARIARFTSPDFGVQVPGWTQAYNRFSYAWNNPYSWVDPFGLQNEGDEEADITIDITATRLPPPPISLEALGTLFDSADSGAAADPGLQNAHLDVQSVTTRTPRESPFEEFERISDDRRTDEQRLVDAVKEALRTNPDAWRYLPHWHAVALASGDDPATREALMRSEAYVESIKEAAKLPLEVGATVATIAIPEALAPEEAAAELLPELQISATKYPNLAENIENALRAGHPDVLTHGGDVAANRAAALEGIPNIRGLSRDEFPFASSMEGGRGSWVGHIPAAEQNSQGALISNFLRANNIGPGTQYRVVIVH
jgi:RHS repeat-associated protein